jgi:glutamyl-tRNA synthetase
MPEIRTRFAPSPTGALHIGSVRTALFAWLYARRHNGKFVLRIENTDLERSTEESVRGILEGMEWLGLDYDEGPYYQTHRMERYKEVIQQLLAEGKAYRCYCSKERLDDLREKQMQSKEKPKYDGLCRMRDPNDPNQPFVVRFKNPETGIVSFDDQVHGTITFQNSELDDLIIARSDGTPTYNFAVVVDDFDMKITHVMRGDDHINNTPRQINLLRALDAQIPIYAHIPMILGPDGTKLSKRHGSVNVLQYRDDGYLPEAMLNYLVRLGWSHGDQEIFSREEMVNFFDTEHLNHSPAAVNPEKLLWLNQHYIKTFTPDTIAKHLLPQMAKLHIDVTNGPNLDDVIAIQAERCQTLLEMAQKSHYFYQEVVTFDDAAQKCLTPEVLSILQEVHKQFMELADWQKADIHQVIINTAEKFGLKLGKVAQPIRAATTGGTISPPIDSTLSLIGKARTISRLEYALDFIGQLKK